MIYSVAEYFLDSLNSSFFESAKAILENNHAHLAYAPYIALYIALIGVNTLDISIVLSQILFLYNLFSKVNTKFDQFVKKTLSPENTKDLPDILINSGVFDKLQQFLGYIPVIPFIITISLHIAYISPSNKFRSLFSRILYSCVAYLSFSIFSNQILIYGFSFITSYILSFYINRLYLTFKYTVVSFVLAFAGTYFFLKTYTKSPFFSSLISHEFLFNFNFFVDSSENVWFSYVIFIVLFLISISFQRLIKILIQLISKKQKTH